MDANNVTIDNGSDADVDVCPPTIIQERPFRFRNGGKNTAQFKFRFSALGEKD